MAFDLRKLLDGAFAQVNPFDNGKNYNSVMNAPKAVQPAQRVTPSIQIGQPRVQTQPLSVATVKTPTLSVPKVPTMPTALSVSNAPIKPVANIVVPEKSREEKLKAIGIKSKQDLDNSIKEMQNIYSPAGLAKEVGNGIFQTGKGIVDSIGNTIALGGSGLAKLYGATSGNKAFEAAADEQLKEQWNKSMPGAAINSMKPLVAPLGASIAYNEQYSKIKDNPNYSPSQKMELMSSLTNSVNQETNQYGMDTSQSTIKNALPVVAGGINTFTNIASAGTPGGLGAGAKSFKVTPTSTIMNNLTNQSLARYGNATTQSLVTQAARNAAPNMLYGAVGGAANTMIDPNATAMDYVKNIAGGTMAGGIMGTAAPFINSGLGKVGTKLNDVASDVRATKYLNSPEGKAANHPSVLGYDPTLKTLEQQHAQAIESGQTARAKQVAKAYQDTSVAKYNEQMALEAQFRAEAKKKGQAGFIAIPDVNRINMKTAKFDDPNLIDAVNNTPGAKITEDGIELDVSRFQNPEQAGLPSVREGVFYLPEANPKNKSQYTRASNNYGGKQEISGRTMVKNPLVVKAATGGKAPELAYDAINGKGAYNRMRQDVLDSTTTYGVHPSVVSENVYNVLEKYGSDPEQAWNITENSKGGNLLPYAIQENIVASAVREAGYDSVLGYSSKRGGGNFLSELFDTREIDYPTPGEKGALHPFFEDKLKPRSDSGFAKIPLTKKLQDFASRNLPDETPAPQVTKTVKDLTHEQKLQKAGMTQNDYADLHNQITAANNKQSELHQKAGEVLKNAPRDASGKLTKDGIAQATKATDDWGKSLDEHTILLNKDRAINGLEPIDINPKTTPKSTPIVTKTEVPKTTSVWVKSKFSDKGGYSDYPIIRQEDNITLYQGSKAGDKRQFWTPNKKYAEQFGSAKEKTGSFYKIDNGNRLTDVYVEVPSKSSPIVTKTPTELPIVGKPLSQPVDNTPQVSKQVTKKQPKVTKVVEGEPTTAERGFIKSAKSSKNVSKAAKTKLEELDNLYEVRSNKELADTVSKKLAEDPAKAYDFAVKTNSDEGTLAAIQLAQEYRKSKNYDMEASLLTEKAKRLTEAGREIQAARLMDDMSPEATVLSAAQTINRYNEQATLKNKPLIPELTGKKAKQFSDRAGEISKMPEGRNKNIEIYKLKTDLADLVPSSTGNKLVTIWKAGLLTSPRTTLRNIIGNTVHSVAEIAKDPFAAINDTLLSAKTGNRELTTTGRGIVSGAGKGLQASADIMRYGLDAEQSVGKLGKSHITWGKNPIEQGMKKYTEFVFNALGAQDKPFYFAAERRSLYDQAGAAAINAGKRGDKAFIKNLVDNPTEQMKITATKDAQTAVFQNSNTGSELASRIKGYLKDKSEVAGAIGDIVMPFTGVPSSIAGQMIAYSPIGLAKGIAKDIKVLSGKVNPKNLSQYQRQASQEVGRGVIGTGLLTLGAYLTAQGLMTGQPKDAEETRQWQLEGKQANSVMVNGKWRSINSVGPEALIVLAGSKLAQGDDIGTAAGNIGKDFMGQTFLSGVQAPLNAISDPTRYAGTYLPNQAASVIPNVVKDAAKALDPTQRETYVPKDIGQSTVNSLKAGIPGLRNDLLPKRDALGNPLAQEPTGVNAFVDLFNSKTPINNPVVNELSRLQKEGQSATPSSLKNTQTIAGEKLNLTPQQLDDLEQKTGQPITEQFNAVMATDAYKSATDEEKKKTLDGIVDDVRKDAKLNLNTGSTVEANVIGESAKLDLAKSAFKKSNKNTEIIGDKVLRKSADGNVSVISKDSYDYQLGDAKLSKLKRSENLKGWMEQANKQLDLLDKQLKDPNVDELDKTDLENKADALIENMKKYAGYGAFTKGKSTSASIAKILAQQKSLSDLNSTTLSKLNSLLQSTTPTKPTIRKAALKQITVRGEKR